MSDDRVAVVMAVLNDRRVANASTVASMIVSALDERALATKWEGARVTLLQEAENCWVPQADLLDQLNALPGAPLTRGDLLARMKNMHPYGGDPKFIQGDPDNQAACLHIYYREKNAGTEFSAILKIIDTEVLEPSWDREWDEHRRKLADRRLQTIRSGRDCGFTVAAAGKDEGRYSRHNGQLYRIKRIGIKQFALFRVNDIGEVGEPTEPHIFSRETEARDAIHGFVSRPRREQKSPMKRVSVKKAAQDTGYPESKIIRLIKEGKIDGYKEGKHYRVDPDSIERYWNTLPTAKKE